MCLLITLYESVHNADMKKMLDFREIFEGILQKLMTKKV